MLCFNLSHVQITIEIEAQIYKLIYKKLFSTRDNQYQCPCSQLFNDKTEKEHNSKQWTTMVNVSTKYIAKYIV